MSQPSTSYQFRYGALAPLFNMLGMGRRSSAIELGTDALTVRMGWAFRATIDLAAIRSVEAYDGMVGGIGVHGWAGRWLVNGAAKDIVYLGIDPPARAWAVGLPVKLRRLGLSVAERDRFIDDVTARSGH